MPATSPVMRNLKDQATARILQLQEEVRKLQEELDLARKDLQEVSDYLSWLDANAPT